MPACSNSNFRRTYANQWLNNTTKNTKVTKKQVLLRALRVLRGEQSIIVRIAGMFASVLKSFISCPTLQRYRIQDNVFRYKIIILMPIYVLLWNNEPSGILKNYIDSVFFVIPAKAGIQCFQRLMADLDPGFRRGDDFLRDHQW
jgi:hypothetical protein